MVNNVATTLLTLCNVCCKDKEILYMLYAFLSENLYFLRLFKKKVVAIPHGQLLQPNE
jgi:hypothetical protein